MKQVTAQTLNIKMSIVLYNVEREIVSYSVVPNQSVHLCFCHCHECSKWLKRAPMSISLMLLTARRQTETDALSFCLDGFVLPIIFFSNVSLVHSCQS